MHTISKTNIIFDVCFVFLSRKEQILDFPQKNAVCVLLNKENYSEILHFSQNSATWDETCFSNCTSLQYYSYN